jgi:hypothetical protein
MRNICKLLKKKVLCHWRQVVEGMPAHFEAKLVPVGDPRLRVEWYKDGRPIQVGFFKMILEQKLFGAKVTSP